MALAGFCEHAPPERITVTDVLDRGHSHLDGKVQEEERRRGNQTHSGHDSQRRDGLASRRGSNPCYRRERGLDSLRVAFDDPSPCLAHRQYAPSLEFSVFLCSSAKGEDSRTIATTLGKQVSQRTMCWSIRATNSSEPTRCNTDGVHHHLGGCLALGCLFLQSRRKRNPRKGPVRWLLGNDCTATIACFWVRFIPKTYCVAERRQRKRRGKFREKFGVPKGIRTPVIAVKGRCPRPG